MKLVIAFVEPFKVDAVTRNLEGIAGFPGISVTQARGFGREKTELPPRAERDELEDFTEKTQITTIVHDGQVEDVMDAIAAAAHTGRYGDGMIFVVPVERAERIKDLRKGTDAL